MSTTFCSWCCCFRFRFPCLSLSHPLHRLVVSVPFGDFVTLSFDCNYIYFLAEHFSLCGIRQRALSLSVLLTPGIDASSTWQSSGASRSPAPRCVPAKGGLLMRVLTEYALTNTYSTYTHTGSDTHSFTRTPTLMRNAPGGPCCGCCRFFRVFRHQMKSAYYVKSVLLFRWRK